MNRELLKKINLLYVEDENDIREFTSKTMANIFNKVIVAKNGEDGLEKFYQNPDINLILTDINMSAMSGLEMCEKIRESNEKIPVVVISAYGDSSFLKKAIDLKVTSYAIKPIDLYKLIENITIAFEPVYLREELEKLTSMEDKTKQLKALMDAQGNIVALSELNKILNVNKKFLEFFGVNNLEEFQQKDNFILSKFKNSTDFLSPSTIKDEKNWILEVKNLDEMNRIVKMDNFNKEEKTFVINIDDYEYGKNQYIISFIDITDLKAKSNLVEYKINHDQCTGLFNKVRFQDILKTELNRAKRYRNEISLITFEIDDFKSFDDKEDSELVNEILKIISKIVLNNTRTHDIPARWTREEFFILLPQTNVEGAIKVSEKINMELKKHTFKETPKEVTLSFGITTLNNNEDEEQMTDKSKRALEKAQKEGKNKTATLF